MSDLKLLSAKLHRFKVTSTHKDYVGSVTIDASLLELVGILPLQEVEIVNVGARWSTYALPGAAGSGQLSPNGGGAFLCSPGDLLIIFSYDYVSRDKVLRDGHEARVAVGDEERNRARKCFTQLVMPRPGGTGVEFRENDGSPE